jgi:hypothetical protein
MHPGVASVLTAFLLAGVRFGDASYAALWPILLASPGTTTEVGRLFPEGPPLSSGPTAAGGSVRE